MNTTTEEIVKDIPEYNENIHGLPTGMRLIIGFTNVYYTLWMVTTFSQVENVRYLQNLSMDFGEAQHKAHTRFDANPGHYDSVDIDLDLKGEGGYNFFRPLAAKRYAPELLSFSRYAGYDMRKIDAHEKYVAGHDHDGPIVKVMSGLLWATYLNTEEKTVRGLRRRIIARNCLVNAGILIKIGCEYLTPDQIKRREVKQVRESAVNGHHEVDGARIEVMLKRLGELFSFDTQYGTTYIITMIDENGRLFKYMGAKKLDINDDEFTKVKATIKHSVYKEQNETKLQRIKLGTL